VLGKIDQLCSPALAPFTRVNVESVNIRPLHCQVRYDALIECGNPDSTMWSNDVFENPPRLLKGERLPRREVGIRCPSRAMPHVNHGGCIGRLKFPNDSL
jgi:hypothetical protein